MKACAKAIYCLKLNLLMLNIPVQKSEQNYIYYGNDYKLNLIICDYDVRLGRPQSATI